MKRCLKPIDPPRNAGGTAGGATGSLTGATGTTTATTGTTGTTGTTSPSTATTGASSTLTQNGVTIGSNVVFNLGVIGDSYSLTLYGTRLPRGLSKSLADNSNAPVSSDLRRISYWLVDGGTVPLGLARQEVMVATSEEALGSLPPEIQNPESYLIADEIVALNFQYFDGTSWLETWNGSMPGPDGVTPMGPPLAIAITFDIEHRSATALPGVMPRLKTYRHVVAVPTANGASVLAPMTDDGLTP